MGEHENCQQVVYYCPTSGDIESVDHGGFDTCCDRPDLHTNEPRRIAAHKALREMRTFPPEDIAAIKAFYGLE